LTLPCKFSYEIGCSGQESTEIFNSFIKPCTLPAEFHHGRLVQSTYEFYYPNMVARQLGCGQLPPKFLFSTIIKSRELITEGMEAKKVFELGWELPIYEPSPFGLIDVAHPFFVSWWQEWHAHIFNISVHSLCKNLQPDFASDSEVISLCPSFLVLESTSYFNIWSCTGSWVHSSSQSNPVLFGWSQACSGVWCSKLKGIHENFCNFGFSTSKGTHENSCYFSCCIFERKKQKENTWKFSLTQKTKDQESQIIP